MSNRNDAMQEQYERVTVLGLPMLFTNSRIDRETVPKELFLYEVRHDDDQQGDPVQLGKWIMVNHWGTLISNKPVKLEPSPSIDNAYRDIDSEDDWNYEGEEATIQEYMAEHPPEKPKQIEHER
jgi:hypothetical protein